MSLALRIRVIERREASKKGERSPLREISTVVIIKRSTSFRIGTVSFGRESSHNQREANTARSLADSGILRSGQVAQVVERSPEKAGVGGSTPSLATKIMCLQ
jgi:hypothetical protein